MESMNHLIQTLKDLVDAHTRLLELAKAKRTVLIDGNILGIQKVVTRESSCVNEIQKLERNREQFVQEWMERKGISGSPFTLEELVEIEDNAAIKTSLTLTAKQLRVLIQDITHLNESNQQLIQTSLSYIQFSLGMFFRKEPAIGYGLNATNHYSSLLDAKI